MNQTSDYDQLLYRLERLRATDAQSSSSARERLAATAAAVRAVADHADPCETDITDTAALLRAGVPDLRAPVDQAETAPTDLDAELAAARTALRRAETHRLAAVRAGQLPPLLPRAQALLRNLIVYGLSMVAAVVVQLIMARMVATGQLSDNLSTWVVVMPPLLFLVVGYVCTGIVGTPRIPMTDRRGEPIPFNVYRSPRLGATLAVLTCVGFLLWQLGVF